MTTPASPTVLPQFLKFSKNSLDKRKNTCYNTTTIKKKLNVLHPQDDNSVGLIYLKNPLFMGFVGFI